MAEATGAPKRWFPLESNPEVMTTYSRRLGLSEAWSWHDVLSVDDWALEMVPGPVKAVVMLFPIKEATETHRREEKERIEAAGGQEVAPALYYMKQTVGNACGTVGIMHALLNNIEDCTTPDSYIRRYQGATETLDADARASHLERDDDLDDMQEVAAAQGQSTQVEIDEPVNTHFVAFVQVEGHLYELDGRKGQPINHGPSSAETLLQDAVVVVKQFMARDPEELRFTITALGPAQG